MDASPPYDRSECIAHLRNLGTHAGPKLDAPRDAWQRFEAGIQRASQQGDVGLLVDVARAACEAHQLSPHWKVLGALAMSPAPDAPATLIALAREQDALGPIELPFPGHPDAGSRFLAMHLVVQHDDALEACAAMFGDDPALRNLFACWIQARVLVGAALQDCTATRCVWDALGQSGHALASLPLERFVIEIAHTSPPPEQPPTRWPATTPLPALLDVTTPDEAARITAPFASHVQISNGRTEGRVFRLSPAVAPCAPPAAALLRVLPMQCLAGVGSSDASLVVTPRDARTAFELLFVMATAGGDYNFYGACSAHGRLAAWRSLAALVGAPVDADFAAIEALAGRCAFASFEADSPWFYHVVTDFGLAVLRPDGASIAVLAGTDSD